MSTSTAHPPHETNGHGFTVSVGRKAILPLISAIVAGGGTFAATRTSQAESPAHVAALEKRQDKLEERQRRVENRAERIDWNLNRVCEITATLAGRPNDCRQPPTRPE